MLRRGLWMITAVIALGLALAPRAMADSVNFNLAISGGADTFVSSFAPGANFGSRPWMLAASYNVRHHGPHPEPLPTPLYAHSLLRFDNLFGTGPGQIPLGSSITRATLRLYGHWSGTGGQLSLYRMTTAWDEDSATWASLGGGVMPGVNAMASPDAEITLGPHGHGWIEMDVTQALQAWASGENNYGWGLLVSLPGLGRWGVRFKTKEAGARWAPALSVEYSAATPEPATAWLVVGALGLVGLRRTRRLGWRRA